jgi:hypothetical protein
MEAAMTWIYVQTENQKWLVGYYKPMNGGGALFMGIRECNTELDAERRVNYLNGGTGEYFPGE